MIGVSLWGLILMDGMYDGMIEQMVQNAIRSDSGSLSVYQKGYRLNSEINKLIGPVKKLEDIFSTDTRIRSFVKRIAQDGMIGTAHYSSGARIIGVDLAAEKRHAKLDEYIKQGKYEFGNKLNGALIGLKLAKKLKLKPGKKIVLSAQATDNEIASTALKVSGILQTNNMFFDNTAVLLDFSKAADLLRIDAGVTQFSLMVSDEEELKALQNSLKKQFPGLEFFRWDEMYPALMQSKVMMEVFNLITGFLVFSVAALGIFGVMLVSVLERIREFGIMLALGTGFRIISGIVLIESLTIGLIGYLTGVVLGGVTLYYFKQKGLDLSAFSEGLEAFGMDVITYAVIRPGYFIVSYFAVFLATVFSVIIPLRILYKAKPIQAINKG